MSWRVSMMATSMMLSSTLAADELPDADLLEFLADWETSDGQWIDPTTLEQVMPQIDATLKEAEPND